MEYLDGERVRAKFLDNSGNILVDYDEICFAGWWGTFRDRVQKETKTIKLWFTFTDPKELYEEYVSDMSSLGVYANMSVEVQNDRILMTIDTDVVTAQELFWVAKVTRLVTGTPDVLHSYLHLRKNTKFPPDLCILLAHFVRADQTRWGRFVGVDHNLCGCYGFSKFKRRFSEVIKTLHDKGVLLRKAYEFTLNIPKFPSYFNEIFRDGEYLFYDHMSVFNSEKELYKFFDKKEYLCG